MYSSSLFAKINLTTTLTQASGAAPEADLPAVLAVGPGVPMGTNPTCASGIFLHEEQAIPLAHFSKSLT